MSELRADVVVVGAGGAGLPAAISARDEGASVIVLESNYDIGGHAMLSSGIVCLGGGTSYQKKWGIEDSADQIFLDFTDHNNQQFRRSDRDLVRRFADESASTFEFLVENGLRFRDQPPTINPGLGSIPRVALVDRFSDDFNITINGTGGSGVVRALEASARRKGVAFLLSHRLTRIHRPDGGRVTGVTARFDGRDVHVLARKGVILATGGHTSNVDFRRMFDARLTEEYQTAGEPWTKQNADGELLAMDIGAGLWGVGIQASDAERSEGGGRTVTKTLHIGARYGYNGLKWDPRSPVFDRARASGLTVSNWQDLILVNQVGKRFWSEVDSRWDAFMQTTAAGRDFIQACLGTNGNLGRDRSANGGGPIWAIFDANAVERERWVPEPPHVDPAGWFFSANSVRELAQKIHNPYQRQPIDAAVLEETVETWNLYVETGNDPEFGRPTPPNRQAALSRRIIAPPFYAAWATPILHDSLSGLRVDPGGRVLDTRGRVIPGLFCAGESAGGFGLHGLPRAIVFGRIAGHEAARACPSTSASEPLEGADPAPP